MAREARGHDHPASLEAMEGLARVLLQKGDTRRAEALAEEVLAIRRRRLGPDHPEMAEALLDLAWMRHHRGELESSEELIREALAIAQPALGERHLDVGVSLGQLAGHLALRGESAEAWLLAGQGDAAGAEVLLREARERLTAALPASNWRRVLSEIYLGGCLTTLGHYGEAEALLTHSDAAREQVQGQLYRGMLEWAGLHQLVRLYETWGRRDEAARYRRRLEHVPIPEIVRSSTP